MPSAASNDDLAKRLALVEDQLAIYQLVSSIGPLVDSNSLREAAELWTEDGTFENDRGAWHGRDEIRGMLEETPHQSLVGGGVGHVLSLPQVVLDGDTAVATLYGSVFRYSGDGRFTVFRVLASRLECIRTADGWQISRRTNQLLDGSPKAPQLLAGLREAAVLDV